MSDLSWWEIANSLSETYEQYSELSMSDSACYQEPTIIGFRAFGAWRIV